MKPPASAPNLAAVLVRMDAIVRDARDAGSRLGYFAALYRRVTRGVGAAIEDGAFDDGPRMDRLVSDFANRYFKALRAHLGRRRMPKAWGAAFDAAAREDAIVLQHLLLALNAHINVDLGAAAAAVCPGPELPGLRRDFRRVNGVISDQLDAVEAELAAVSPRLAELDAVLGDADERFGVFSIVAARDDAWRLGVTLDATPPPLRSLVVSLSDEKAAFLARLVARPSWPTIDLVVDVRTAEEKDVRRVLDVLAAD